MFSKVIDRMGNTLLSPPRTAFGSYINHGPRTGRSVALTFDDGPVSPSTDGLLDVLGELGVKATFFVLGAMAQDHPDLVRRMFAEGHTVANHSQMHARSASLKPWSSTEHIDRTSDLIESLIGRRPGLYRPPWGWLTPWEAVRLRRLGLTAVGWDLYPDDWKWPEVDPSVIVGQILPAVRPGSIVLLHDARPFDGPSTKTATIAAVASVVGELRDRYDFVTVDRLLGVEPYLTTPSPVL
jgi:peptidoglycan/xylan/chitin deacetylase (PgdA/CDA1 family)